MKADVQTPLSIADWDWPHQGAAHHREAGDVRLGVVMLCHEHLHIAAHFARHWAKGGAAVAIHVDAAVHGDEVAQFRNQLADLDNVVWAARRRCDWGSFSLVAATQDAASMLLDGFPDVTHVLLVSGTCLPLRPVAELVAYLGTNPRRDYIESVTVADAGWVVGGLSDERFRFYFPFSWRRQRRWFDRLVNLQRRLGVRRRMPKGLNPHLGSQWWCLTRKTLDSILNDPQRPAYDRFFRQVWIPDESYFQTLARLHASELESRSLTLAKFDSQGKPYVFYDDHIPMLSESRSFVARKVWPRAYRLMQHFPLPETKAPQVDPPRPARIERLINHAVARRALGRPGLYMQSRFPIKDRENGKTSAPYAVFQGFGDVIPGFEDWLSRVLPDADIHGHIFGPDEVEFKNRASVGPGALSSNARLRDYDPQRFLASLIRMTQKPQIFLYGPRDNQALNWFMTTDPNAHFAVVTGAWALPLMHSGMPFDDIRRMAAHLQAVESAQLDILRSVWTKAQVQLWELADLLARPAAVLRDAVDLLAPGTTLSVVPPLVGTAELGEFLQALRNAGLRPRLMGEIESEYWRIAEDENG